MARVKASKDQPAVESPKREVSMEKEKNVSMMFFHFIHLRGAYSTGVP